MLVLTSCMRRWRWLTHQCALLCVALCAVLCGGCRLPFQFVEGMEGAGERRLLVTTTRVVKMRGNAADTPYVVERAGNGSAPHPQPLQWEFELSYARLEGVMPLAQQMMVASRLPAAEQEEFLQVRVWMLAAERRKERLLLPSCLRTCMPVQARK